MARPTISTKGPITIPIQALASWLRRFDQSSGSSRNTCSGSRGGQRGRGAWRRSATTLGPSATAPATNHRTPTPYAPPQRATKYLARGWWQMSAEVVCSGWYWKPVSSLTSMPMREASSSSATFSLSSRSGHAG